MHRLVLAVFVIAGACAEQASASPKPNVLIMVADDLGFGDVGFNGGKTIATPNLDRLAATGVRLTDFRACPMCSPTRAGLLTGRWPSRFGIMRAVLPPWTRHGLPPSEKTMPELMAETGYAQRAMIGKWHLGHARREFLPLAHGFTQFYGHYNGAIDYFTHHREGERDWHQDERTIAQEGYATDLLGAEAVRFIANAPSGKPWLLYLAFNAPHSPFQAKEEDLKKYTHLKQSDRQIYAAMVDCMDQAIGRVLAAIEARADAANTLVVFFSDNGGIARVGSNAPWRGAKLSVYEGGTRVCAAIRWPAGGLAGGKRFNGRIGYIDLLPTVLAAAGVKSPDNLDGMNVLPALRGAAKLPDRPWFSYIHQAETAHASVHEGKWKLLAHGDVFAKEGEVVLELYNLEDDPAEKTNVLAEHKDVATRLRRLLIEFGKLQAAGAGAYSEGRQGFRAPKDWVIQ